jgi:hypothetical protein
MVNISVPFSPFPMTTYYKLPNHSARLSNSDILTDTDWVKHGIYEVMPWWQYTLPGTPGWLRLCHSITPCLLLPLPHVLVSKTSPALICLHQPQLPQHLCSPKSPWHALILPSPLLSPKLHLQLSRSSRCDESFTLRKKHTKIPDGNMYNITASSERAASSSLKPPSQSVVNTHSGAQRYRSVGKRQTLPSWRPPLRHRPQPQGRIRSPVDTVEWAAQCPYPALRPWSQPIVVNTNYPG